MFVVVFAVDLHAVEHAVVLVLNTLGQYHLAVAGDFEVDIVLCVVGEGEAAYLGGAVFQHGHLGFGLYAVVDADVANLVAGEADVVVLGHEIEG